MGPSGNAWTTRAGRTAGPQGWRDKQGHVGARGPAGPRGEVGPPGPQGAVGPQGPQGEAGTQGPAGPAGQRSDQCGPWWAPRASASLHVRRVKQGTPSTHPIMGDELRALRRLQREQEPKSPFVFTSERGAPFTTAGFARMMERAGFEAAFRFKPHPHMLWHACGYKLANDGQDTRALQAYLGHRNIQHTVRYSELALGRFKNFWR
jgi:hypothetical protein